MAISKARMQVKRGNESDFDPSQMLPGEWAVSLDTKYVRMCFAPGICVRMATYDAFEADMEEIRDILLEAQTIQEAVARIQTEINDTAVVVEDYSILSKSYAVGGTGKRENENSDNAKYYYEQTKQISQGINGIVPMGTVAFADLPTSNIVNNAMYNVSDAFTSDYRFNDGGGIYYGPGNNVIWTAEGKWDVTASSSVTGIKGSAESAYRVGNVNITPANIGLGNVNNTSDADKPISTATQAALDALNGSLIHVKSITNDDLNNYTDNAILLFGTSAVNTIANRPANEACVVHVRKYLGWVQQYAISNNTGRVFVRTAYDDGTGNIIWANWEELASKSDLNQLRNHVALMGTLKIVNVEAMTTTNGVERTIATITLPKGVWMISGYIWTDGLAGYTLAIHSTASVTGLVGTKAANISGIYINSTDSEVSVPINYTSWGANERILSGTFKAVRIRKDEIVL